MSEKPTRGRGRPKLANPTTSAERMQKMREKRRQAGVEDICIPLSSLTRKLLRQLAKQRGISQRSLTEQLLKQAIAEAIKRNK